MSSPEKKALVGSDENVKTAGNHSDGILPRINAYSASNSVIAGSSLSHDCTALPSSIVNPQEMDDAVDERWTKVGMSEDILPVILDNLEILTPRDLLNFRFVNRIWRDVATSVLCKRSACDIALGIYQVTPGYAANLISDTQLLMFRLHRPNNEPNPPIFKFLNARPPHSLLPELTRLISTSPKFPLNSITFRNGCDLALVKLSSSPAPANENYLLGEGEKNEILKLFSLYGKEIKTLTFLRETSTSIIQKLLYVHLPNVIFLNLRNCPILNVSKSKEIKVMYSPSENSSYANRKKILKLELLYMGRELTYNEGKINFLEELVIGSPNLREVHDAGIAALSVLTRLKKINLIRSVNVNPCFDSLFSSQLEEECAINNSLSQLKLSKLTAQFGKSGEFDYLDRGATRILNTILQKSKNTLEYLELFLSPKKSLRNIQIPSMRTLKCLRIVRQLHHYIQDQLGPREEIQERGRLAQENLPVERWVNNLHEFRFENEQNPTRIPPGYFPALSQVVLDVEPTSCETYHKILAFFTLEHCGTGDGSVITGDILPSVTTLELTNFPHSDVGLGKLFPNLVDLKIQCLPHDVMSNWVWEAFPKLERFELYDFVPCWEIEGHYSFFTGIAHHICAKCMDNIDVAAGSAITGLDDIRLLRSRPYIGDCSNLKELTIKCKQNFSGLFLTKLARLYETKCVTYKGKIIFWFDFADLSADDIKEIQENAKQVSSYVEVRL